MNGRTPWTRGPWVIEEGPHWLTVCRADAPFEDGKRVPIVGTRWSGTVCEDERANACLIAAAPEMAEALSGLIRVIEAMRYTTGLGKNQTERLDAAKALLTKIGATQ